MSKLALAFGLVLVVMYIVPFPVYFTLSTVTGLQPPDDDPVRFMISILVTKVGVALAFVLVFYFARDSLAGRWAIYAFAWWLLFFFGEIGQAIGPNYTRLDAVGGIISEALYCPLSAYLTNRLLQPK